MAAHPALLIVQRFDTLFADHDGFSQPVLCTFALFEHVVEQVVAASVLNAVPVPDVVLPPGHAVQDAAPALLYDPVAHAVWVFVPSGE